ncbi:MAG: glycosyltransferase family 4 protein [Actinomycetota bacterium]|nr:glycosyltransferase family 4 protein [Actinomycetota bacterium]
MIYWVNQYAVAPDQPGGTRHLEMARELVAQGREVTIVASDLNLNLRRYLRRSDASERRRIREVIDGVRFVWLSAGHYERNDWRRALSMLLFAWQALRYLLTAPTRSGSVFIGSTPHLPAAAATWIAARLGRVPFVLEVRDLWPESMVGVAGTAGSPLVPMMRVLSDLLYRRADAIVVLARPNIDRLVERGADRERISYIPNGVDPSAFEDPDPDHLSLDVPPEKKVLVYTGAHGPANGLDIGLYAARQLMDWGADDVHMLLVGDGPAKEDLVGLAGELDLHNVTFADPIPKQQIPALLDRCHGGLMLLADVEVFRYGVSPNKLFDYLSAGLPVVTNVPGEVARIVEDADAGVVVPPADPTALAGVIARLAAQDRGSTGGPAYVRAYHDRRKLAADLAAVVDRVLGDG